MSPISSEFSFGFCYGLKKPSFLDQIAKTQVNIQVSAPENAFLGTTSIALFKCNKGMDSLQKPDRDTAVVILNDRMVDKINRLYLNLTEISW